MAIQAQLYLENLGFPLGGDDIDVNSSQDWMENACGFNDLYLFNLQQQQWQQLKQEYQQSIQQQKNQDLCFENGFLMTKNNVNNNKPILIHSQCVASYVQKQNQEIEGFINLQNESLRSALQGHRKQQLLTILKKYDLKSQTLLRQKDEEITKATNRTIELEDFLRKTDFERQTWQRATKESEATIINLNNTIELLQQNHYLSTKDEVEDAESCCQNKENEEEKQENVNAICKNCFSANSCVVLLPCRHLCSCKSCDAFLDSCPVCKMVKKASIEVFF